MGENRGGIREGSGRNPIYDEPTKTMRVPVSRILEIKHFLADKKNPTFNDVASIKLIKASTFMRIPLASEKVAAGFPSPAQDYIEKTGTVANSD